MSKTITFNEEAIQMSLAMTKITLAGNTTDGRSDELWRFLNTVERFTKMDEENRILFFRLALTASDGATRNGYDTYSRAVLTVIQILSEFGSEYKGGVRALLSNSVFYEHSPVFDTTIPKKNGRIAATKRYMEAAVALGWIDVNHLNHLKTRKIRRTPTPASEEDVKTAVSNALSAIKTTTGCWSILAFRNLVLLDWKSYGLRSVEMSNVTRQDFLNHPDFVPIRVSKSERGKRTHVLAETTRKLTLAYIMILDRYRAEKGQVSLTPSDPLFVGLRGGRLTSAATSSAVSKLLPDGVRPHDLRARIGTHIAKTRAPADVAQALGIGVDSVGAYVGAGDAYGIGADVASHHALVNNQLGLRELGIELSHPLESRPESPCWLPPSLLGDG